MINAKKSSINSPQCFLLFSSRKMSFINVCRYISSHLNFYILWQWWHWCWWQHVCMCRYILVMAPFGGQRTSLGFRSILACVWHWSSGLQVCMASAYVCWIIFMSLHLSFELFLLGSSDWPSTDHVALAGFELVAILFPQPLE